MRIIAFLIGVCAFMAIAVSATGPDLAFIQALYSKTDVKFRSGWADVNTWTSACQSALPGITCDSAGAITSITLNGVSGTIPDQIGSLTALTYVDLSNNYFTGNVPSSLGSLTMLTHLNLAGNRLGGVFAADLSSTSLTKPTCDLTGNCFTACPLECTCADVQNQYCYTTGSCVDPQTEYCPACSEFGSSKATCISRSSSASQQCAWCDGSASCYDAADATFACPATSSKIVEPLPADGFVGPPYMRFSWVPSQTVTGTNDISIAMLLPMTTPLGRKEIAAAFTQMGVSAPDATFNSRWTITNDDPTALTSISLSSSVIDMVNYGSPKITTDGDNFYLDWDITLYWKEVAKMDAAKSVVESKRDTSGLCEHCVWRPITELFSFRLVMDRRTTVESRCEVETTSTMWAIIQRSVVTVGVNSEITIHFRTVPQSSKATIDPVSIAASVVSGGQIESVSKPVLLSSSMIGARTQDWSVTVRFVSGTCKICTGDDFNVAAVIKGTDPKNPMHTVDLTLAFRLAASASWCTFTANGTTRGIQQTYLTGRLFDGGATDPITRQFWIADPIYVRAAWSPSASLPISGVTIERVDVSGSAVLGATGSYAVYIAGDSQNSGEVVTGYTQTAYNNLLACQSPAVCYSFNAVTSQFTAAVESGADLTIRTTCVISYAGGLTRREVSVAPYHGSLDSSVVVYNNPYVKSTTTTTGAASTIALSMLAMGAALALQALL